MSIIKQLFIIFSIFFYYILCDEESEPEQQCLSNKTPVLVVIALDGFKNSYYEHTKYLKKFRSQGVSTNIKALTVSNALNTFHSVATGYTAQKHGVVGHKFGAGATFEYNAETYKYKRDNIPVIPIWILNEIHNGISGCMMWPGAEFPYENRNPTYAITYNKDRPLNERFEDIMKWFEKPQNTWPNLVMIYIEEPDKTAHIYSPDIPAPGTNIPAPGEQQDSQDSNIILKEKLIELDKELEKFNDNLNNLDGLQKRLNIIYLSDHSLGTVSEDKFLSVEETYAVPCQTRKDLFLNMVQAIYINTYKATPDKPCLWDTWSHIDGNHPEMNSNRIYSWNMILPKGVAYKEAMAKYTDVRDPVPTTDENPIYRNFGAHGWLNDDNGIFMAKGPAFKTGVAEPFRMYDFYSLFAKILRIKGHFRKDGNYAHVKPLLRVRADVGINWIDRFLIILACAIFHCTIIYFYGNAKIKAMKKARQAARRNRNSKKNIFSALK